MRFTYLAINIYHFGARSVHVNGGDRWRTRHKWMIPSEMLIVTGTTCCVNAPIGIYRIPTYECGCWVRGRSPIVRDSQIKSSAWNFCGSFACTQMKRLVFILCDTLFLFSANFLRWNFDLYRSAAFIIFFSLSSPIHPLTPTIINAYLSLGRERREQSDSFCCARARLRWFFAFQNDANQSWMLIAQVPYLITFSALSATHSHLCAIFRTLPTRQILLPTNKSQ